LKEKKYIKGGGRRNLNLMDFPIKKLPGDLKVGRNLNLDNTQIKELPDNLKVGRSLDLRNTPLSKKYTKQQIKDIIEEKGGYVNKYIFT
jgi:hypothetical protein